MLHDLVRNGDLPGLIAAILAGQSIDQRNAEGFTPLMIAVQTQQPIELVRWLIEQGADLHAVQTPPPRKVYTPEDVERMREYGIDERILLDQCPQSQPSVLGLAYAQGSREVIQLLLDAGADVRYVDPCGYSLPMQVLARSYHRPQESIVDLMADLLHRGAPSDARTAYNESPLKATFRSGDTQCLRLLLEAGANPAAIDWTPLSWAVAYESLDRIRELASDPSQLHQEDFWGRTPFFWAVQIKRLDAAKILLEAGSDDQVTGFHDFTPLQVAITNRDEALFDWLLALEVRGPTAKQRLTEALRAAIDVESVAYARRLIEAGADPCFRDEHQVSLMAKTMQPEMALLLEQKGVSLDEAKPELRQKLVGHAAHQEVKVSRNDRRFVHRTFGKHNPQQMNNPFWDEMVRTRVNGYMGALPFGLPYVREAVWCFDRFGHTMTRLPDGRLVEIAGEHEDYYDPDFCIYNDVVVHHGDGTFTIYGYPKDVFPPTDFHTATLVGGAIYLIGSLGYPDDRRPGETPVYRLDTQTFEITAVPCQGETPGWISRHQARLVSPDELEIQGGEIYEDETKELTPNQHIFRLNLTTRCWRRVDRG